MRACGILMHISSLPSPYGIGTLGAEARRFAKFLHLSGQTYWQILPIGPTGYGDSPYMPFSSYAGNPYFVDLDTLVEQGLLTAEECNRISGVCKPDEVDYASLYISRFKLLRMAFERFLPNGEYAAFCAENAFWLDDYALFMALKNAHGGAPATEWERDIALYLPEAVEKARIQLASEVEFQKVVQYWFFDQWFKLKEYCGSLGIRIIGDIPIYVSADSSDLWASPKQFALDDTGRPAEVAGCPPDGFSADGQVWGNPLYNWDYMARDGFSWWIGRMKHALKLFDIIRIDHFRGFDSYWCIPFGDITAASGRWRKGPGIALFEALERELGELPIIAEDLGFLTPSVLKLLADTGFPGMKVLQFAFTPEADSLYLPHKHTSHCVIYTGTHDNDTIAGWFASSGARADCEYAKAYLRLTEAEGLPWGMIRSALASPADTCIITMQDLLGLGSEARMNTPATLGGNWKWRINGGCINDWLAGIILESTVIYHRENPILIAQSAEETETDNETAE